MNRYGAMPTANPQALTAGQGLVAQDAAAPQNTALDANGQPVGANGVTGRVTGDSGPAAVDHVNIYMRSQPWYQQILQANGGNAKSDAAKKAIIAAAQQHGVQVDEGHVEVDDSGNFKMSGMPTWGKVLIVAGIAAATIATMGAAGVFAAAGAPEVAGTIGTDAAFTTGAGGAAAALGTIPAVAGSTGGLAAAGAGTAATAAGLSAGGAGGVGAEGIEAAGIGGGATGVTGPAASAGLGTDATFVNAAGPGVAGTGSVLGQVGPQAYGPVGVGTGTNWLSPAIGVAGQLAGAAIQSGAVTKGAELQAQATAAALAWQKQRYADAMGSLQPYIQAGTTAEDRMAQLLGLPARAGSTATPGAGWGSPWSGPTTALGTHVQPLGGASTAPGSQSPAPALAPAPAAAAPAAATPATGAMVTMREPGGTTNAVPASQVPYWQKKGAVVVGAA